MVTLTQLAGSTEYVQFQVAATEDGSAYDPTADSVAVAFAPVTSPPAAFNAGTATWYTAAWETDSGNPVPSYWASILVGPGGAVALPAGAYACYVRVTDSPAVPVRLGCYLIIT